MRLLATHSIKKHISIQQIWQNIVEMKAREHRLELASFRTLAFNGENKDQVN